MILGIAVSLTPPLLLFNFILYLTGACLAAWAINRNIDSQNELAQNNIGRLNWSRVIWPFSYKIHGLTSYHLLNEMILCMVPLWRFLKVFLVFYTGDYVTTWFLPLALISCMVGLGSVLAGVRHIFTWRAESLVVATVASLIAFVFDLISLGLVTSCFEINQIVYVK